jgi:hypothetical protein
VVYCSYLKGTIDNKNISWLLFYNTVFCVLAGGQDSLEVANGIHGSLERAHISFPVFVTSRFASIFPEKIDVSNQILYTKCTENIGSRLGGHSN